MGHVVTRHDTTLIRGDNWDLSVGLGAGWDEVVEDPGAFTGRVAFRGEQDDAFPVLEEATAEIELTGDTAPDTVAMMHFSLTAAETAALPPYDLVFFAELQSADRTQRLFEGKVDVTD